MLTRANTAPLLTPAEVGDLLVQPALSASVAAQVATAISTASSEYRVPLVTADPTARWTAEGEEIAPSDMEIDEATTRPSKVAGLTIITRELANDSSPAAANAVGEGLARDIARRMDEAFFGNLPAPAPTGLTGTGATVIATAAAITNTDVFVQAIAAAEGFGAAITSFVAHPLDALALALVKKGTGSNEPLLGADPTAPTKRTISGVNLYTSPAVTRGSIWGIPGDRVFVVVREDATVEADHSVFFTSDRVAVRATMRVGFLFSHAAAIQKITTPAA